MTEDEKRLAELGIHLPKAPAPVGVYQPVVLLGDMAYLSGQLPRDTEGKLKTGRLGSELTLEEGKAAARMAALNVLSVIQSQIGLDRFERMVRLVGYVQCEPSFKDIHLVLNGASELFGEVFGVRGRHARSAVGMASLPLDVCVELEATVKLKGC
ncbi:RidA family protein [Omnitrophica bacterium]|nr:RidA family protein [Candidatus Omnitrophota bacterium]